MCLPAGLTVLECECECMRLSPRIHIRMHDKFIIISPCLSHLSHSLSPLPAFLVASWSVRAKTYAPRISSLHFLWSHCWCCCYCWHAYTPHTPHRHTCTHSTHRHCRTGTGPKWNQFKCAPMCRFWIMITNVLHSFAVNVCVSLCVCECKWAAQGTGKYAFFAHNMPHGHGQHCAVCFAAKSKKKEKEKEKIRFPFKATDPLQQWEKNSIGCSCV